MPKGRMNPCGTWRIALCASFLLFSSLRGHAQAAGTTLKPDSATRITVAEAQERLRAKLYWDPLAQSGFFLSGEDTIAFAVGAKDYIVNRLEALVLDPPLSVDGVVSLSEAALMALSKCFEDLRASRSSSYCVAAILIDPGHGGKDPGAIGEHETGGKKLRILEKDIALTVGLRLRDLLSASFPGLRVILTRDKDAYPSLEDRVEMANSLELARNEAVIYVSLHVNASFNKNARGYEVWYLNPEIQRKLVDGPGQIGIDPGVESIVDTMIGEEFTNESVLLAQSIIASLGTALGSETPDRGIRPEEWFVVKNAKMPSVLVEMGFITNPEEARLLSLDDYLMKLSQGIYNGLVDFIRYFEGQKDGTDR